MRSTLMDFEKRPATLFHPGEHLAALAQNRQGPTALRPR